MTCFALVRGRAMRATRLDGCGRIAAAECSSITTDGFVSIAFTANLNEGTEINQQNASGRSCIYEPAISTLNNYSVVITFCDVNPELYAMLTGQSVVYDSDGEAVGFRIATDVDPTQSGFALEVWSGVPSQQCGDDENAEGSFGYTLLPFLQGGTLGDFTIENGAVTFTINNAQTKSGSGWGVGPYDVVPGAGGPGPLLEPIGPAEHVHVQWTTVAPPEPGCDCVASGPEATGATAGTPGTWTPVDSYPPESLAALQASGIVADPATAWAEGEYVVLGDSTEAHWTGTAWAAGRAPA